MCICAEGEGGREGGTLAKVRPKRAGPYPCAPQEPLSPDSALAGCKREVHSRKPRGKQGGNWLDCKSVTVGVVWFVQSA